MRAPALSGCPHERMDFYQHAAGVLIVLGMLGAVVMLGKQRGLNPFGLSAGSSGRIKRMQVVERLPLTAHHSLHLVAVDGQTVLVAVSPGGCQLLARNSAEPES